MGGRPKGNRPSGADFMKREKIWGGLTAVEGKTNWDLRQGAKRGIRSIGELNSQVYPGTGFGGTTLRRKRAGRREKGCGFFPENSNKCPTTREGGGIR